MRTWILTAGALLALALLTVTFADDAQAAPIGGAKLSIAPDVVVGFGCGCPPPPRRVVVVRRRVVRAPVVVRRVYAPSRYLAPYYGPYYRPSYYRPYSYGPRLHVGFGHRHYSPRYHRHGTRRVIGRRR